jgi:spore coat polysaccharide biosynthesis protein SpsF
LAVIIVQARMGSHRLPGKMMANLAGHPLIWHILQRACCVRPGLPVVLATTEHPRDLVLVQEAENLGIAVVRGSEDDVLGRFLQVLQIFPARWVVRICGDSPLFDPAFLNRCLTRAESEQADVVKFKGDQPSLFQGGEVVSARSLRFSRESAGGDPLATEHVTAWAMKNAPQYPEEIKTTWLDPVPDMMQGTKLSIDTPQDLENLRDLYSDLHDGQNIVDLEQAAAWIARKGWRS